MSWLAESSIWCGWCGSVEHQELRFIRNLKIRDGQIFVISDERNVLGEACTPFEHLKEKFAFQAFGHLCER